MLSDKLKEECGVVGVIGDPDAASLCYLGLYALQHRGQEACGIVSFDLDGKPRVSKAFGLVGDAFNKENLNRLEGEMAIGHNRYSTHGGKSVQNIQPFYFKTTLGKMAIAHNGNLTNAKSLRSALEDEGSIFHSSSDTEVFMHLLAKSKEADMSKRILSVMKQVTGAYSLVILTDTKLFAVRDPLGFRPLVLGKKGSGFVVASETCALDLIDAKYLREIEPGEVVGLGLDGQITSEFFSPRPQNSAFCSFEAIYFSRPDSKVYSEKIYSVRKNLGQQLAKEYPTDADIVIAVPDSGVPMAMGYSEYSELPYEIGLVRNHYVGRTFIEPSQSIRDFGVRLKLNPIKEVIDGKRVVVVDDSIVRGTTCKKIIRMLRLAGAAEIHMRVGSPPITHSCFYGVDTPGRKNLLAAQKNVAAIKEYIGADSLGFLSLAGLRKALADTMQNRFCYGCFSGQYPEVVCTEISKEPTDLDGPGLYA